MEYYNKEFCLEVWGDIACFTRPEFKVERVSYDVITPSAARNIFQAIFWKPAIRWEVFKIEVLNPIKWTSVRRNEVASVASTPVFIEQKRQQKNTLMLRDVRYRLWARLVFIPMRERQPAATPVAVPSIFGQTLDPASRNPVIDSEEADLLTIRADENPGKYNAMFERRARKGQCFTQPYLGTRECAASFRFVDLEHETPSQAPIADSRDLGYMLYDLDFESNPQKPERMFFHAKMQNGVIIVPPKDSEEVKK